MTTLTRCDLRDYRECSCPPDSCKIQLGRMTRELPPFGPGPSDIWIALVAALAIAATVGMTIKLNDHYGRQDRIQQEDISWRK